MKGIICFRRMRNCPKPHLDLFSDNSVWTEAGDSTDSKAAGEPGHGCTLAGSRAQGGYLMFWGSLHMGLGGSSVLSGRQAQDEPEGFSPHCGYLGSAESCLSPHHSDNSIDRV